MVSADLSRRYAPDRHWRGGEQGGTRRHGRESAGVRVDMGTGRPRGTGRWRRRRRERDEDGAAALLLAVVLTVVLLVSAFVVDLGMQRVARSDMQALADVVALDLARELDGRSVADLEGPVRTAAAESLARNGATVGDQPTLDVELGELDGLDGPDGEDFRVLTGAAVPSAVRVSATTAVGFAFGGLTGRDAGDATRSAVAEASGGACFQLGSYAAALDTADSALLGPLLSALGSNVALTVADYHAIAAADVDLLALLGVELAAGTLEELVDGSRLVGLGDFYLAVAEVLQRESGRTAAVGLLETIAASVGGLGLRIPVADLLSLGTGGSAGLDATLNVLDLVTAAAAVANGEHAVDVPGIGVDLGPLADLAATLTIIEPPRLACGRPGDPAAVATTSQVALGLTARALDLDLGPLLRTEVALRGDVRLASAEGRLTEVRCDPPGITVAVSDGLLTIDLELRVEATVAGIPVLRGPVVVSGTRSSSGTARIDIHQPADYDRPVRVGAGSSGLPFLGVDTSGLKVLGLPVGWLLNEIVAPLLHQVVNPLVQALDQVLLTPLSELLGLQVSGADVFARPEPRCATPALRG